MQVNKSLFSLKKTILVVDDEEIKCGVSHDRDINAANNILRKGIEMLTKGRNCPDSLFMLDSLESSRKKPQLL